MQRQRRKLTVEDRVAIDLRRRDGWGVRAIARELGRSPSVISTEIGRGRDRMATTLLAQRRPRRQRGGGRRARLAPDSPLCQSASEFDPRSACKVDPLRGWWMRDIWV